MWLIYGILTTLCWGAADLFYKKGADERDSLSQFKTVIAVGFIMGLHAALYLVHMYANGEMYSPRSLLVYLPVSAMYILSMLLGYVGLRFIALSVSSPIQNSSGAVVALMCFLVLGRTLLALELAAVVLICAGVFTLSLLETRATKKELSRADVQSSKLSIKAASIVFPVLYCFIDAIGTFLDDIWLDESAPKLSEDDALVSYELMFFMCACALYVYIRFVKKEKITFAGQRSRTFAALFETAGQFFYVFIIGGNGMIVAPLVSSYCVVSMLLSRIFLKERLTRAQYAASAVTVLGIILLAIVQG